MRPRVRGLAYAPDPHRPEAQPKREGSLLTRRHSKAQTDREYPTECTWISSPRKDTSSGSASSFSR
jgi:hypothetical protein